MSVVKIEGCSNCEDSRQESLCIDIAQRRKRPFDTLVRVLVTEQRFCERLECVRERPLAAFAHLRSYRGQLDAACASRQNVTTLQIEEGQALEALALGPMIL